MDSHAELTSRPYEDRDIEAVCDLLNLCDVIDRQDDHYSVEQLKQRYASSTLDRFNDQHVWEDAQGRLGAFAQVWSHPSNSTLDCYFYFRVHPDMRGTAIDREIIDWAVHRSHEAGQPRGLKSVLMGRVFDHDAYSRGLFEQQGFQIVRFGLRMERPLRDPVPAPVFPDGYTLRHAEGEEDIAPWVDCYNHSFIDHWGFHPDTVEERKHHLQRPGYHPEQDLVAVAPDGTFAAFCLWYMDDPASDAQAGRVGIIGLLGTRRGHRGLGLGRAMLMAGLQHLKESGADIARLGVDAENPTGAAGLYERAGFEKVATRISYHKDV